MNDAREFAGLAILLFGIILSGIIGAKAGSKLDDDIKVKVKMELSHMRIWNLVPIIALFILMLIITNDNVVIIMSAFIAAFAIHKITIHIISKSRLKKCGAPASYIRLHSLAQLASNVSVIVFLILMSIRLFD